MKIKKKLSQNLIKHSILKEFSYFNNIINSRTFSEVEVWKNYEKKINREQTVKVLTAEIGCKSFPQTKNYVINNFM